MTDLVERYNGIEQDPEGVYVLFKDFERLQAENKRLTDRLLDCTIERSEAWTTLRAINKEQT